MSMVSYALRTQFLSPTLLKSPLASTELRTERINNTPMFFLTMFQTIKNHPVYVQSFSTYLVVTTSFLIINKTKLCIYCKL